MDIEKDSNREAFESWFESRYDAHFMQFALDLDMYVDKHTQTCWEAWQAAKAQAVQEWISVEDSLPPVDETVLVCWDYATDIEPEKEYLTLDEDYNECWPNCQDKPPTHWMPIPQPPKAQEPAKKLELDIPAPFEPKEGEKAYRLAPAIPCGYTEFYFGEDENEWQFGAWRSEDEIKQVVAALRQVFGRSDDAVNAVRGGNDRN